MVCVADEPRVQCIVRDLSQASTKAKYEVTLPASTPVHTLITRVANKMNYEPHSFQLILQKPDSELTFTETTQGSLEDAGFCTELGSRNSLLLQGIQGYDSNLITKGCGEMQVASPAATTYYPLTGPPGSLLPPAGASSPAGDYTYSSPLIRHDTGYVGLVNQAMTCYLNSLLQALYMTPEFRNALYKWKFDPTHNNSASKCIPFQLQKLFLNLQTSTKTAVETTELTRSFGWESGEVWQQHDIQELCRVMFDALEQEFKETEQADLINQLYQGKMIDYVKCLECSREKSREDTFLDIPLPVRPFSSTIAYGSIEEALRAFVQPETLDGNNQYFCESCNKKCDAHKGLKFSKFPYLLTLHLKRFDFDYSSMHRIKLNDKVVFPQILDLNTFVRWSCSDEEAAGAVETPVRCDDSSTADSALDDESSQPAELHSSDQDQEEDEGIDMSTSSGNHTENEKNKPDGDKASFTYELYSIMIHSGSASGGHYYAYIKDFTKGEWFCFNDQSVTRITQEDIVKTFGGGPTRGYYSGAYSSSTNAYMLMYRQIDKDRNVAAITEQQLPPHIMKLLEEIKESEENERAMRARQEEMVKIKVYTSHPTPGILNQTKLYCYNDTQLKDILLMAYQNLKLEGVVPLDHCRLVSYSHTQDQMEESLEGREKETINEVLQSLRNSSNYEMFLEIREQDQVFTPYNVGDISMTVFRVDLDNEEVLAVNHLRTSPCQCLPDLREFFCTAIPLPSADIHIVVAKPTTIVHMTNDSLPLNKLGFFSSNRVYICPRSVEPDIDNSFPTSRLYKFIERVQNIIIVYIILPDTSQDALERLLIPLLSQEKINGNNNRHIETTPPGEREVGLGLSNGLEEEGACSGGASGGGTSDQSTSEDSSLTDSERTIIGDVPNEGQSSPSDSDQQLSSPEQPPKINEMNGEMSENWDDDEEIINKIYYFKCTPYTMEDCPKMLKVVVDKLIDMNSLKNMLESYVGVQSKYMKVYRGPDPDRGELCNSLSSYRDEEKLSIKLHRVLNEGEYRVKLYLLSINAPTPVQFICDWIITKGSSVGSTKRKILKELEKKHDMKISFERCRMWRKIWKNQSPGKVLLNGQLWEEDVCMATQKELFVEELEEEDNLVVGQLVLFTRRWHPSTLTLGPFKEIIVDSKSSAEFKKKLSEISDIPAEHIKFAKGMSPFPCEMSVLSVHQDLDWDHNAEYLVDWKLSITDDGIVVFYRDEREELKLLSREEQQEVNNRESARLNCTSSAGVSSYSPRKEKALKIYLDNSPKPPRTFIDID